LRRAEPLEDLKRALVLREGMLEGVKPAVGSSDTAVSSACALVSSLSRSDSTNASSTDRDQRLDLVRQGRRARPLTEPGVLRIETIGPSKRPVSAGSSDDR
jgi:hypothetical protein